MNIVIARPEWFNDALCAGVDPNLFYPGPGESIEAALEYCDNCPVRTACLNHALDNGERQGIWGGQAERARARIKTARRKGAA